MPYGTVNAGQVAQAYTVPLEGVTQALQYYDQLAIHKQNRQAQLAQQKQAEDYRKAALLEKAFEGTDVGTGTPYDEVGHTLVAQAKDKVTAFLKANPGAQATDIWAVANDATKGLLSGIDNAKKASAYVESLTKMGNAEYPHLDQNALKAFYQAQVFRDKDGKILPTPNLAYTPTNIQDPNFRAQFMNPEAAQMAVRKELTDGIKPEPYQYESPDNPGVLIKGKARPYYIDAQGRPQMEVQSWDQVVQGGNPIPAAAMQFIGATPQQQTAKTEKQEFPGVTDYAMKRLKAGPVFNDMLINEVKDLRKNHGDLLKGASDTQIEKLAAHNLLGRFGSREGEELPAPDFKIVDHLQKQEDRAFNRSMKLAGLSNQNARLGMERQRLEMRRTKDEQKQKAVLNSVPGLLALAASDPKDLSPKGLVAVRHAQQIIENNREKINIGGVPRVAINLSAMHGKQLYKPGTKTPIALKTVDMGGRIGQVVVEVPMKRDPLTNVWIEDVVNYRAYGDIPNADGQRMIKRNPADVLQQYDPQFNPIKNEYDEEWNEAYPDSSIEE